MEKDDDTFRAFVESESKEIRQEKGKVCFGSGLERTTFYFDTKGMVSKHGRQNVRENNIEVGPGKYDISSITSAMCSVLNRPTSKLGTVLGGRREERRLGVGPGLMTPAPGAYNIPTTFPDKFKQACAPFNKNTVRDTLGSSDVPGVGMYNVSLYKRRTVAFRHTFGGKKYLLPAVKTKCGPYNFDICFSCKKPPEGDYWYLDIVEVDKAAKAKKTNQGSCEGAFLCRECYEIEKKENNLYTKSQIRNFKKIRDCSKVHFHDGCEAKLFLVPAQEIAKVKVREAYLALYFN